MDNPPPRLAAGGAVAGVAAGRAAVSTGGGAFNAAFAAAINAVARGRTEGGRRSHSSAIDRARNSGGSAGGVDLAGVSAGATAGIAGELRLAAAVDAGRTQSITSRNGL